MDAVLMVLVVLVGLAINFWMTERLLERRKNFLIDQALDNEGIRRWEYNELASRVRGLERELDKRAHAKDTNFL